MTIPTAAERANLRATAGLPRTNSVAVDAKVLIALLDRIDALEAALQAADAMRYAALNADLFDDEASRETYDAAFVAYDAARERTLTK